MTGCFTDRNGVEFTEGAHVTHRQVDLEGVRRVKQSGTVFGVGANTLWVLLDNGEPWCGSSSRWLVDS